MVASLTQILREQARQVEADDSRFLSYGIYFFELEFPAEAVAADNEGAGGQTNSYIYPLVLNPESIRIVDNFTLSKTPTSNGGLYIEESGVLEKALVIRGTTGMRPRVGRVQTGAPTYPTASFNLPNTFIPARGRPTAQAAFSGQRHFQFLQDKIFRVYGDLKRAPQFSERTVMNWHNVKDEEHFRVVPERFTMTRDIRRRFLYEYEIVCAVVGLANAVTTRLIEPDRNVFDRINDAIRTVRKAVNYARAAIQDVVNFADEVNNVVRNASGVINDAAQIVQSVDDAVTAIERVGTTLVTLPLNAVRANITAIEDLSQNLTGLPFRVAQSAAQSLRRVADALDHFAFLPDIFDESPVNQLVRDANRNVNAQRSTDAQLRAAAAAPPTSVIEASRRDGTAAPGDLARLQDPLYATPAGVQVRSANAQVVQGGENIAAIAGRYLGDARRWRELAAFNQLRFPYISDAGLPNTLRPGDTILIPSEAPPQNVSRTPGIYPGDPNIDAEERVLGRDFALIEDRDDGFVDFAVDANGTDFTQTAGVGNLTQALRTRLTTERGTSPLLREMGYRPLIGLGFASADADIARIRLGEAVSADPRIDSLQAVELVPGTSDAVQVRISATVRGFREPVRLNIDANDYPLNTV